MKGKRLVILGAGESGTGTAVLGLKEGYEVFVSDRSVIADHYKKVLNDYHISWEEGQHTEEKILNADVVMKSPGIPDTAPIVKRLRSLQVQIVSELEFGSWYCTAKKICVTGSNGKTTTASLIFHMFKKAGLNVALAGNIGDSFAMSVALHTFDYYVLEISSFQLDDIDKFKADVAVITNITPDHLDRYDNNFELYVKSKFHIINNQSEMDVFIFNNDDPVVVEALKKYKVDSQKLPFSLTANNKVNVASLKNEEIEIILKDKIFNMKVSKLGLKGKHNVSNSMAAAISAMVMNIKNDTIREALSDFKGIEHRLERVSAVRGIEFINDSKATNVNSTWYALECMKNRVVWIAGGTDKGNDYRELLPLVSGKVKALICIGKDNKKLKDVFSDEVETLVESESMEEAVKMAYFLAHSGDTVLLSPACASFDRFKNYEDRGNQFKNQVRKL